MSGLLAMSEGYIPGQEPPATTLHSAGTEAPEDATFTWLTTLLNSHGAEYALMNHAPEGRTGLISQIRGHPVGQAAKCMIVMVKVGKKVTRFVLGVVPGDRRIDLAAIQKLKSGTFAGFADVAVAERLAQTRSGSVLPFAVSKELELVVDPLLLQHPTIYFNAARLDCSVALRTSDYIAIAKPLIRTISAPPS